jgi:RNA polymerase sigma-70 factor (ECF subfamily)
LNRAELRAQVRACIDRLPDLYRTIILLRDIEELDTQETAELLGVSLAVVKTRLHRAHQALRSLLEPLFRAPDPCKAL